VSREAQPSIDPSRRLTLEEAIAIGYRNHADVAIAQENVVQARERVTQAKTPILPTVTAALDYSGSGVTDLGGVFGTGPRRTIFDEGLQPSIRSQYTFFDQGQTRLSVRQARSGVTSAQQGLRDVRRNIRFNITSDYIGYLRSEQERLLREEQVRLAQQQLELVDAEIQVGKAARSDREPVRRELAQANVRRIEAQNNVNVSASALRNSMGLSVGQPLMITELPQPDFTVPGYDESVALALRNRPDLAQDVATVDASSAALSLARLRRRAVLEMQVSANVTPKNDRSRADWGVGAGVTMPIWDAGLTRSRAEEAEARLLGDRQRLGQTRKDIEAEVQQALLNLASAKERVDASKVSVEAAQVALDAANAKYQQGLARIIDLTDAQVGFFSARIDAINALYDFYQAQAQLDRAVGKE
jgi:outer membrane protein TolC